MSDVTDRKEKRAHIYQRDDLDWYVEPDSVSTALFRVERFIGDIYDPACGCGNIVRSAIAAGYGAYGSDIKRRTNESWFTTEIDFLTTQFASGSFVNIVTNPPFYRGSGTEAFIRRALEFSAAKVCVFTSIKFLAGDRRANGLFADYPPSRVWILTPRPSCPPGEWIAAGNKAGGGTNDWCWITWDRLSPSKETRLGWLSTKAPADE